MNKILAFTLAETLIVMGVIGIVSALTLPNLNSSTGDKDRVAKVKKIYQNLNDAFGRAESVYGPYNEWFVNDGNDEDKKIERTGERITEFMKVSKTCGVNADQGCFTSGNSKSLQGIKDQSFDGNDPKNYLIITADGTSISISSPTIQPNIVVDIDGPTRGKYQWGHDIFFFNFDSLNGIIPEGNNESFSNILASFTGKGQNAAAWIIKYDNADYLKLDNRGRCPNGFTPTETNPRCK